jgi:uncharacterized protein YkwD
VKFISASFDHRRIERNVSLIVSFAFIASLMIVAMVPQLAHAAGTSVSASTLVTLANVDRANAGARPLTVNDKLVAAAQAKANDMAQKSYFAHVSPNGSNSWSWFSRVGYSYSHAGENLAVGFVDAQGVETGWMNSPTHRANLMNGAFTEVGIATAEGIYKGQKVIFVAQMFGTPSNSVSKAAPVTQKVQTVAVAKTPSVLGAEVTREDPAVTIKRLQVLIAALQAQLRAIQAAKA